MCLLRLFLLCILYMCLYVYVYFIYVLVAALSAHSCVSLVLLVLWESKKYILFIGIRKSSTPPNPLRFLLVVKKKWNHEKGKKSKKMKMGSTLPPPTPFLRRSL
jgi:hypothetical protein